MWPELGAHAEMAALGHLVLIELTAKAQVPEASRLLLSNHLGIPLGVVYAQPCREGCAHRGTDQESGPPLPDLRTSTTRAFLVEVPAPAIVAARRQVECKPWEDAEAG